jgi:hypothetical protein
MTISETVTDANEKTNTVSQETKTAIAVKMTAGMEFPGIGSGSVEVDVSQEKSQSKSFAETVSRSKSRTESHSFSMDLIRMRELGIVAIWQWVAKATMEDGREILIETPTYTYTSDSKMPSYFPYTQAHTDAILGNP